MADGKIKISELNEALTLNNDAEFPYSQENGGVQTTFKAPIEQIARKVSESITYTNLTTTAKTLVGAINELKALGSPILLGTSAPTAQQGANGNLYVQYTEGTGGADDEVDAIFVKIDGAWCEISTGGGGGSGGHTIVDDTGTSLTQRTNLQFNGTYLEDNSTDDTTEVNVVRSMTYAEFQQLTEAEKKGLIEITDVTGNSENEFQPVIYSEDEREIGVWTDGKPLYEKTYHNTAIVISSNSELVIDDFTDMFPVDCRGVMQDTTDGRTYYPSWAYGGSSDYNIYYKKKDNGNLVLYSENDSWGNTWELFTVVRYTKSSDSAGSGQWTPQGVPAVHYSTEEQVIGTWVDGSTLYQKTINVGTIGSDTSVAHGIANLDTIIDYSGFGAYASTDKAVMPFQNPASGVGFGLNYYDTTNLYLKKSSGLSSNFSGCYITIRYTKSST